MKISINIDEDLVSEIDTRANKLHLSRSAYISVTMSRAIQNEDMLDCLPVITELAEKMKDVDFTKINFSDKKLQKNEKKKK